MTQETLPFWLAEALALEQPADPIPLGEHIEADIAIVGGGYTGLWSAIKLKQQDPALRVLS
jgi:monoamine oxidase